MGLLDITGYTKEVYMNTYINSLINDNNVNIDTLCKYLKIKRSTLHRILVGNYIMSKKLLYKMAEYFNIPIREFVCKVYNININYNELYEQILEEVYKEQFTSNSIMLRSTNPYFNLGYQKCIMDIKQKLPSE